MLYKKSEQPIKISLWYLGVGCGTIIGALASYGLQHYSGMTFKSWQIMFLVFGLITFVIGICVVLFLPDNPMTRRLSQAERLYAIERLRSNLQDESDNWMSKRSAYDEWSCQQFPSDYYQGVSSSHFYNRPNKLTASTVLVTRLCNPLFCRFREVSYQSLSWLVPTLPDALMTFFRKSASPAGPRNWCIITVDILLGSR